MGFFKGIALACKKIVSWVKSTPWAHRSLRTAWQAAVPAFATTWGLYTSGVASTGTLWWTGVGIPVVSALIAAYMNKDSQPVG